jgi:hypothetical protein
VERDRWLQSDLAGEDVPQVCERPATPEGQSLGPSLVPIRSGIRAARAGLHERQSGSLERGLGADSQTNGRLVHAGDCCRPKMYDSGRSGLPPGQGTCTLKVFVSHAHEDADTVARLREVLAQEGFESTSPLSTVAPGEPWAESIDAAISNADVVLVVQSKAAAKSQWVGFETALAISKAMDFPAKRIVPLFLDEDATSAPFLWRFQGVDMTHEDSWHELISALRNLRTAPENARETVSLDSLATTERALDEYSRMMDFEKQRQSRFVQDRETAFSRYQRVLTIVAVTIAALGALVLTLFQGDQPAAAGTAAALTAVAALIGATVGAVAVWRVSKQSSGDKSDG